VPADCQVESDARVRRSESCIDGTVFCAQYRRLSGQARPEAAGWCFGVEQRWQFFRINRDEIGGILSEIRVGCEHDGDRLADVAQPLPGEDRLAIGAQRLAGRIAEIDRREVDIVAGPHRGDAGRRQRCRDVDSAQHRMGVGRAHDPHVQLMREAEIADELAAPGDQRRVFEPRHRPTDHPSCLQRHLAGHLRASRHSLSAARTAATMPW
jgi:hypothetical protein